MRGRVNMPPDAVIALVQAVKQRQKALRDHTKLDVTGWTVRNQAWKEITEHLNAQYGRELTVEQCVKKFLNVKTMVKYKLDEESRSALSLYPNYSFYSKRQQPGFENFVVRLTPAEQEYLHQFHGINRTAFANNLAPAELASSSNSTFLDVMKQEEGDNGDDVEFLEDNTSAASQTGSVLLAEEDTFRDFLGSTSNPGGSLTDALLSLIPADLNRQQQFTNDNSHQPLMNSCTVQHDVVGHQMEARSEFTLPGEMSQTSAPSGMLEIPLTIGYGTAVIEQQNGSNRVNQSGSNQSAGVPNGQSNRIGPQKRKAAATAFVTGEIHLNALQAQSKGKTSTNGQFKEEEEDPDKRLKRLKCELIEMQKLEFMRREEWRLKKEFMLGRQTAALENMVLLLRAIKEKK